MSKNNYQNWTKEDLIKEVELLKKRKKFGLVWEDKKEDVVEQCKKELPVVKEVKSREIITDKNKPVNLLIEGDNYHALSVLNYTHEKKVDVIYIDPPYNTGAKDWKYNNNYVDVNDAYRHSKWLNMMSKRLQKSKNLLKNNGVLICAIDDNEFYRLGALLEDIFPSHEIHCITIVHNPRGIQGKNFSYTHEYAYFVFRKGINVIGNRKIKLEDISWRNLRDNGGESLRTDGRNCFYPIIVMNNKVIGFGYVPTNDFHPQKQTVEKNGQYHIWPIDIKGVERKWRYARQSVEQIQHLLRTKKTERGYEIQIGKDYGTVRTVWQDSKYDANEYGTKLVHSLVSDTHFDFPKSVYNTYDCIAPILYERKEAIILDFFAGSGTTGHAVLILNKEDNGRRRFILCTNNENGIAQEVCYPRIKAVIKGNIKYEEITKINANLKYFKTDFVDAEPTDKNKKKLTEQATEMLCIKEETFEEVLDKKTFKIFKNNDHYTGIIFDQLSISEFKKEIKDIKSKFSIYIFSLGDDAFDEEFVDVKQKVKLSPIPEAILRVYRRIFR
ncbi:MAG: site-specific DNA-methyltransferase [Candidatus Cloacimonetes bacterium]|nr:site-specific DNA-methyltransferase [Candidatus Cloacimonadota bacterium]